MISLVHSRRQRGFSLIELLLALAVVGAISVVIISGAVSNGRRSEAMAQAQTAAQLAESVERAWATQASYSSVTTLTALPYAPQILREQSTTTLNSAYGSVSVGPGTETYSGVNPVFSPPSLAIQYAGLPRSVCVIFASTVANSFDNVSINSASNYAKVSGGTYNPSLAASQCSQASNTVYMTRLRAYPVAVAATCLVATSVNPNPYSPTQLTNTASWTWLSTSSFKSVIDGTVYYTNPPLYNRLFAADGTPVC